MRIEAYWLNVRRRYPETISVDIQFMREARNFKFRSEETERPAEN
jgi:hypothetical protein